MEEAVVALEKEVVECLRRRDKQWTKQLKERKAPEVAVPTPAATSKPVPSTSSSSYPPTDHHTTSTASQTEGRAKEGTTCNKTSSGQEVTYIFSVLPFSSEEVNSAQQDDVTLSISPSIHQTDRIAISTTRVCCTDGSRAGTAIAGCSSQFQRP